MSEPTLSVFFIIKDEEKTFRRALESVVECADEYVIGIDRASTDKSEQIAKQFAKDHPDKKYKFFKFAWRNNFAAVRNMAIRRCTCDWIFQLDGHEYLARGNTVSNPNMTYPEMLQDHMKRLPEHVWLVAVRMLLEPIWPDGIPEIWFIQPHLFRNHKGIKYVRASHNQIPHDLCPVYNRLRTPDIVIVHDRPPNNASIRKVQREEMNIPYFKKILEKNPNSEEALYYLGMSYVDAATRKDEHGNALHDPKVLENALGYFSRYIDLCGDSRPEEAWEAASKLGQVAGVLGQWDLARKAFFEAFRLMPTRAEAPHNLGMVARHKMEAAIELFIDPDTGIVPEGPKRAEYETYLFKQFQEAKKWFEIAMNTPAPITSYFLQAPIYIYQPKLCLAELYESIYCFTGQSQYFSQARTYYEEVKRLVPHLRDVGDSLSRLKGSFHRLKSEEVGRQRQEGVKTIAVFDRTMQFTKPLIDRWCSRGIDTRAWQQPHYDRCLWGDVLFCEWVDQNLISISERKWDSPLYARLWRYEMFTDMPSHVKWENVDGLIVPSEALKKYVYDTFNVSSPIHVIYPGVDLERFTFKPRAHGENVALIAFLHSRKGMDQLAQIVIDNPDKTFHIAGRWQERQLQRYFNWMIQNQGATDRVVYYHWQDDINEWLDKIDANYLLSCSWGESFGFNIAEAMAKGIKPVIREFEGCHELWPEESIYRTVVEANDMLSGGSYESTSYREWVADRYDSDREAQEYLSLFFGDDLSAGSQDCGTGVCEAGDRGLPEEGIPTESHS